MSRLPLHCKPMRTQQRKQERKGHEFVFLEGTHLRLPSTTTKRTLNCPIKPILLSNKIWVEQVFPSRGFVVLRCQNCVVWAVVTICVGSAVNLKLLVYRSLNRCFMPCMIHAGEQHALDGINEAV